MGRRGAGRPAGIAILHVSLHHVLASAQLLGDQQHGSPPSTQFLLYENLSPLIPLVPLRTHAESVASPLAAVHRLLIRSHDAQIPRSREEYHFSWAPHSSALRTDPTSYDDLCSSCQLVLTPCSSPPSRFHPALPLQATSHCDAYPDTGSREHHPLAFSPSRPSPPSSPQTPCSSVATSTRSLAPLPPAQLALAVPHHLHYRRSMPTSLAYRHRGLRLDVPLLALLHSTSEVHSARVRCGDGPDGVGHLTMQRADTKQSARARGYRAKRRTRIPRGKAHTGGEHVVRIRVCGARARYSRYWLRRCWCTFSSALGRYRNEALHAHCGRKYGGQREKEESTTCGSVAPHTGYCCMRAPIVQRKGTRKTNIRRNSIARFEMYSAPGSKYWVAPMRLFRRLAVLCAAAALHAHADLRLSPAPLRLELETDVGAVGRGVVRQVGD
ncbi:hypothetical protein K438DRAFT_1858139 [Mycena galopus ATCC 62051]|nr:hypothetical protein K438DRAFT_1858139 [Mycena galopus ATCC 62051]